MTSKDLRRMYESAPDPPCLAGLSSVDWAAVEHAHGPATDVPALLRAVASDDPAHRDFAWELLFETVWHQGTVYAASAVVVPFLFRLLEAEEVPDRRQAVQLLGAIADGRSYLAVHADTEKWRAIYERISAERGSTLAADLARELEDVAAARRAVGARLDLLVPYLRDPRPFLRQQAALTLGRYPEAAAMAPELADVLRELPDEYMPEEESLRGLEAIRDLLDRAGRGRSPGLEES